MSLPTTADIFVDRAKGAKTAQDVEQVVKELGGTLHDGALEPNNNLDDEPMAIYRFPDDSQGGAFAAYDDDGNIKGFATWRKISLQ